MSNIKAAIANIIMINDMLKCKSKLDNGHEIAHARYIGIIKGLDRRCKHSRITCSDDYNILQYFPGYFEKKELWNYLRTHSIDGMTFGKVVRGEYPNYLRDYNNQKSIDDCWV